VISAEKKFKSRLLDCYVTAMSLQCDGNTGWDIDATPDAAQLASILAALQIGDGSIPPGTNLSAGPMLYVELVSLEGRSIPSTCATNLCNSAEGSSFRQIR
jgi:hypothetical protein